jgi:hypothetical protein
MKERSKSEQISNDEEAALVLNYVIADATGACSVVGPSRFDESHVACEHWTKRHPSPLRA